MMKRRQQILAILLITVVSSLLLVESSHATSCESSKVNIPKFDYQEDCTFCDSNELTMKEKCEELVVKALTDEKNLLDDGIITKETAASKLNITVGKFEKDMKAYFAK